MLHLTDVGMSVAGNRDTLVAIQPDRHGCGQKQFIIQMLMDESMNLTHETKHVFRIFGGRRDQFNQSFGIVGGDPWMS